MRRQFQTGTSDGRQPAWLRLLAVLCLVVVCLASTVQVCHSHPESLPGSQDSQNYPAQDHCPLCVAMHSALPVAILSTPVAMQQVHTVASAAVDGLRTVRWRFDLFSRPPPSVPAFA